MTKEGGITGSEFDILEQNGPNLSAPSLSSGSGGPIHIAVEAVQQHRPGMRGWCMLKLSPSYLVTPYCAIPGSAIHAGLYMSGVL